MSEALDTARTVTDKAERACALVFLLPFLPKRLQARAVKIAFDTIADAVWAEDNQILAKVSLARYLTKRQLAHMVTAARHIEKPDTRALTLGRLVPYVAEPLQDDLRQEAFAALQTIEQTITYNALTGQQLHEPEPNSSVATVLAELAPILSPSQLNEALALVDKFTDVSMRLRGLEGLASPTCKKKRWCIEPYSWRPIWTSHPTDTDPIL